MIRKIFFVCLCVGLAAQCWAGQIVVLPADQAGTPAERMEFGYEAALRQELRAQLGADFSSRRIEAIMDVLRPERDFLARGYSEVPRGDANATNGTVSLDVHVDVPGLRNRLHDMGVLATRGSHMQYVLRLENVDPARTKRLGVLQMISGLRPVPVAPSGVPVLQLGLAGQWRGELVLGDRSITRTARDLDDVWFGLWKVYFAQAGAGEADGNTVVITVSGWLSSTGPMEFDEQLNGWNAEIGSKSLVGVDMTGPGMSGTWRILARDRKALLQRLQDTARAQELTLRVVSGDQK